jgi:SAM-dependent methyltransferase
MNRITILKELNAQAYERIAHEFDRTRQVAWQELTDLGSAVKDNDRVADLGCGNGRLLKALPKVNFDYVGIDANAHLINQARYEFPGQAFSVATLEHMELELASFDVIFCIAAFHHLIGTNDRLAFLQKCHDALKPGGQLCMTVWNLWQPKYVKYYFHDVSKKVDWNDLMIPWNAGKEPVWRYYHAFTKRGLRRLLEKVQFRNVEVTTIGRNYVIRAMK